MNSQIAYYRQLFGSIVGHYPIHNLLLGDKCTTAKIKSLLDVGNSINSIIPENAALEFPGIGHVTPLHIAVVNNSISPNIVRFLLDNGADVQATTMKQGQTPLHAVIRTGTDIRRVKEIAILLLDHGSDIHKCDRFGVTALYLALFAGCSKEIIQLLLVRGATTSERIVLINDWPLHMALRNRKIPYDTIKLLLDRGAVVNRVNSLGNSPLRLSVYRNDTKIIKLLLDRGAFVSYGNSPIKKLLEMYDAHANVVTLQNLKLLLKYALLEDAVLRNDCTCNLFSGHCVSEELMQFWRDCLQEIYEMQLFFVDPATNLLQIIFYLKFKMRYITEDKKRLISDKLMQLLYHNSFPLYAEVVCSEIKMDYLLEKLEERVEYTLSKRRDPLAGVHVLRILATYLSKLDLFNLVLAFYNFDTLHTIGYTFLVQILMKTRLDFST